LSTVTQSAVTETLVYNALAQRIKTSGGAAGTVLYAYDEAGHLIGEYDGSGNLIEETVWLGDIPVATVRPHTGGGADVFYVHTDQLSTPRALTRPSDNMLMWSWFSDPFGTDAANENPSGAGTFKYNPRFAGQIFDGQAGLHDNGYRAYDPAAGGYTQSDPIGLAGGSYSTYAYAGKNPLSNTDPSGGFVATTLNPYGAAAAVGFGIGTLIYDLFGSQIQDVLEEVIPYPSSDAAPPSDPTLQQEIERKANEREYHRRCSEPPPPGLDPCERAKWMLKKAQECKAMRIENTNRWWGGVDSRHDPQLFRDLDNAIKNAQDAVDRLCNKCK
jgi:RHS repeat-associated protein